MADEQHNDHGLGDIEDLEAPESQADDVRGGEAPKQPSPPPQPQPGNFQLAGSLGLPTA